MNRSSWRPPVIRGFCLRLVGFGALWFVLTAGSMGSWIVGAPVVVGLSAWGAGFAAKRSDEASVTGPGLASFLPYFVVQSVRSGVDVAVRAWRPQLDLSPSVMTYPVRLPDGPALHFFVNTITLMPGTLSALWDGSELRVHVLDDRQPVSSMLRDLENRIARLFGLELSTGGQP